MTIKWNIKEDGAKSTEVKEAIIVDARGSMDTEEVHFLAHEGGKAFIADALDDEGK